MPIELDLKALREHYEQQLRDISEYLKPDAAFKADHIRVANLRFILRQIERVEACGSCEATGNRSGWQDAETGLPVPCLWCKRLRADLLELQKEVIG